MTMKVSSVTSAAFNQNPSRARREADKQPLVITEHGKASYVLVRPLTGFRQGFRA